MSTLRVGLTGGLASGKTTVARWLREAGLAVLDADRIVAELYAPGAPGAQAVERLFGPGMLDRQGGVDHPQLAARVFAEATERRRLEAAIHPLVKARFAALAAAEPGIVVLEATLLAESGFAPLFDLVVSVEAPAELRLARAIGRGMPEAQARARLVAQGDGAARRAAAHRVLDSSGSLDELHRQVDALIAELALLAKQRQAPSS